MSSLTSGSLLIASPEIDDEIFHRAVLLLCEHSHVGSFALIINKPFEAGLPPQLEDLEQASKGPVYSRLGGPIQGEQMMLIHTYPDAADEVLCITDGVYLGGDSEFLQRTIEDPDPLIVFFGYMGWGEGHLEREFLAGLWYLHPARPEHVFNDQPQNLWRSVLREMGGKYATLAMIPDDLSLN